MPFYITIEVEKEADAKALVQGVIDMGEVTIDRRTFPDDSTEVFDTKVVWVARRPAKFCNPTDGHRGKSGWTRGRGYGWWVCAVCHLPTEEWANNMQRMRHAFGVNLLPEGLGWNAPDDTRSDKIWRDLHPGRTSQVG
jgi:hypothetical protein